jgi:hypothetical protein
MKKLTLWSSFVVIALGVILAYPLAFADGRHERSDCPGKVICPLTGEEVCKDRCPLTVKKTDSTRADCPGQIECPLTEELVCRDQCPVATLYASKAGDGRGLPPFGP